MNFDYWENLFTKTIDIPSSGISAIFIKIVGCDVLLLKIEDVFVYSHAGYIRSLSSNYMPHIGASLTSQIGYNLNFRSQRRACF